MSTDVTLPALGESVTEGTVTRWLKAVGDTIAADEPLLEVSTDKVDTEIPSPAGGVLLEILVGEDETVDVGTVVARIGEASEAGAGAPAPVVDAPVADAPVADAPVADAPVADAPVADAPVADLVETVPVASVPEHAAVPEAIAAPVTPAVAPAPLAARPGDATDVLLPALGESVTEGTVTRWLKSVGDTIVADEPLLEVSTDKVDTEIPAPASGTLLEILVKEDETVDVGTVVARIGEVSAAAPVAAPVAPVAAPVAPVAAPVAPVAAPVAPLAAPVAPLAEPAAPALASTPASNAGSPSGYVTPIVRKLASDSGVDLGSIAGTGVGGRIRKEDILAATPVATAPEAAPAADAAPAAPAAPATTAGAASPLRGTTVKMSRIRALTADKMMESLHGMAQLTSIVEVDCSRIWNLRAKAKDAFEAREGAKLTFLPFFTKAVADALVEHAFLNASVVDGSIVYHPTVNLSLAVDTEKGLMLPTLRDADTKSLADHARGIADLASRARTGGLTADEISGGTFSITNTGSGGTLLDTPIVPSPQVGILATTIIEKRVVVSRGPQGEDVLSIKPMCYLPLSYDHRIVDGADAARFLQTVKARIEAGAFEAELGL
jgi:2-oxoglutarate dehydrogenase E2 component (dihydrolipoamide succinyltransferase)